MTLPKSAQEFFKEIGMMSEFGFRFFKEGFTPRYEFRDSRWGPRTMWGHFSGHNGHGDECPANGG
jgi:hypothetical protein